VSIQLLCGECSGRIVVELADDVTAAAFVTALKAAVKAHWEYTHETHA